MAKTLQKSTGVVRTPCGAARGERSVDRMQIKRNQNNNLVGTGLEQASNEDGPLTRAAAEHLRQKERAGPTTVRNANDPRPIHFYYFVLFRLYVITHAIVA
jgi:hypothetical protein